ncbi:MAG TPA: glycoside hydrolase family 3 C-terminal domain-containing protein [Solirubrobacteraceae bacterium]|nr:glycoside hydrolase family 3 C-terminal domain-containing protein [Solirubrobacteraceae bacterium]
MSGSRRSAPAGAVVGLVALALAMLALAALAPGAFAEGRCGSYAWCNSSLSASERAQLMLAAMSQSDKVGILTGQEASDIGLPAIKFTDGAVGAGGVGSGTEDATAMPAGIALAANFDQAMARRWGEVVGAEVRHRGFDGDYGPTVNVMRTPLGGRTYEGYGEDPHLDAQTAVGWIDGFQSQGVMADVKHFAANNQEGQAGVSPLEGVIGGRLDTDVNVDPRWLHEIEFPAFEAAVEQAHSATVMCSYNLVNGVYSCANQYLLKHTLREEWGFPGYVASDAGACHEPNEDLEAGLNVDILNTCYSSPEVDALLAAGIVSEATLDERVLEILRTLFAFGFFDHPTWPKDISQDNVAGDEQVADEADEGGSVLLGNNGVLPIDTAKVHSIAVIGPAANQYIHGNGSSEVTPYLKTTALAGIEARAAQAHIPVAYNDGALVTSAEESAQSASLAIVVVGDTESEGVDKACMSLTPQCSNSQATPPDPESTQLDFGDQDELIEKVAAANPDTVVVMETGAPVLTPWRSRIAGLLEAWYPGEDGGTAIAHVLFGDVDPGGRLPATFPQQESDIPTASGGASRYPGVAEPLEAECEVQATVPCPYYQEQYSEGVLVGYRWYDEQGIEPAFPFGFGLSYTQFRFSGLKVKRGRGAEPSAEVSVTVKNVGKRTGWSVPEVYVALPSSAEAPEPPLQLRGFQKLRLAPHRSARVTFALDARSLSHWSDAANAWEVAPGCDEIEVGPSSQELPLRHAIGTGRARCHR